MGENNKNVMRNVMGGTKTAASVSLKAAFVVTPPAMIAIGSVMVLSESCSALIGGTLIALGAAILRERQLYAPGTCGFHSGES